jgi:type III secretory pathway lipoprotein EscJ
MVRVLLFLIVSVCLVGCREELVHVASELEANKVMLGLRTEGIDARKVYQAKEWVIDVPKSRLTDALRILENKRVFREESDPDANKKSSDLFSSRQEKEARANMVIASSLSSTLRVLPEVLDARVHIYQNKSEPFTGGSVKDRTASVLLVVSQNSAIPVEQIKELVSQGGGLHASKVSVVLVESREKFQGGRTDEIHKSEVLSAAKSTAGTEEEEVVPWDGAIPAESRILLVTGALCLAGSIIGRIRRYWKERASSEHDQLGAFLDKEDYVE